MHKKTAKALILLVITVVLLSIITANVFLLSDKFLTGFFTTKITGKSPSATFGVGICINTQPNITGTNCPTFAFENMSLTCQFFGNSSDWNQNVSFSSVFNGNATPFSVNSTGGVYVNSFNFTSLGNHTYNVTAQDSSFCSNNQFTQTFNILINSSGNHPPYLVAPIPNSSWSQDTILVPYDLDLYFADPDGDALTYTSTFNPNINIQISGGGIVTITPAPGFYGIELIYFYALDIYNASGQSNLVRLEVTQVVPPPPPTPPPGPSGDDDDDASGIPGGARPISCLPEWDCGNWTECLPQSFQIRECFDENNCDSALLRPDLTQNCNYTATCFDRVKNQGEVGVDCGGPCQTCIDLGTCFDGVKNQDETSIDCGGICLPCSDKKHCYDGLQNYGEQGIDCGSVCDRTCPYEESPASRFIDFGKIVVLLLLLLLLAWSTYEARKHRKDLKRWWRKLKRTIKKPLRKLWFKQELLIEELESLEEDLPTLKPTIAFGKLSNTMNAYLQLLLKTPKALTAKETHRAIIDSTIDYGLKEILKSLFLDIAELEFSPDKLTNNVVLSMLYEGKNLFYKTLKLKKPQKKFKLFDAIKPVTSFDGLFESMTLLQIDFLNDKFFEVKNTYLSMYKAVTSQKVQNKYFINAVKRFHKLYNLKNVNKK